MKRSLKLYWLWALMSGKYHQTSFALRKGNRFCPLGVLLDILDPHGWYLTKHGDYGHKLTAYSTTTIPKKVADVLGLEGHHIFYIVMTNDESNSFRPTIRYIVDNI